MVDVGLEDGTVIEATDGHPFWDATTGQFTLAVDLEVGELVLGLDGRSLQIASLRVYGEDLVAYNLEIEGIHTYYAGQTPVLVHNSCTSDAEGIAHATANHTMGGSGVRAGAGVFDSGVNLESLAAATRGQIGSLQTGMHTSLTYTIRAPEIIGTAGNGMATNVYQAVRNFHGGDLLTMFPVAP